MMKNVGIGIVGIVISPSKLGKYISGEINTFTGHYFPSNFPK
jgi:hypothetical protein